MSTEEFENLEIYKTLPFVDDYLKLDDNAKYEEEKKLITIRMELNVFVDYEYGSPMWYQMTKSKICNKLVRF